ncbi:MAG TPA: fibronectin type III domain-containing protein [Pyrinomonadaceae bacterium]
MRKAVLLVTMILFVATSVLLQQMAGAAGQTTIPADPTGLTVTDLTSSSISIAWTDNSSDEDGFKIERCTGANCTDFQLLATMPTNVASITDWGLSKNRTYKYRVAAYNSAGDSGYTNTTTATTLR